MSTIPKIATILDMIKGFDKRLSNLERLSRKDHSVIVADKKLYLDGNTRLNYIIFNSVSNRLEFWVDNLSGGSMLAGYLDANNTGTRIDNV